VKRGQLPCFKMIKLFGKLFGNNDDMGMACPEMLHEFAESLGIALDARDKSTHNHSLEVADVALMLAKEMKLSVSRQNTIHVAGHLHDIGKIAIPDSVLKKKGPLSEQEWRQMKCHPVEGARIVAPIQLFNGENCAREIILHHHERYDGKGYPDGLLGIEIPLGARIIAVADTVSAMLQHRCYRRGMTFDTVEQEIVREKGQQFCPNVVDAFVRQRHQIEGYFAAEDKHEVPESGLFTSETSLGFPLASLNQE